jgi:integrase
VTRLRKIMLEELQRRNYSAITTRNYLRVVADFAKYFGKSPDKLGPNKLRTYQAYLLQDRKLTPGTVVSRVAALRFFFVKTLKRHQFREFLPYPQDRRRLPTVLSREEVSHLINAAGTLFRRTLLMTLYGTGMRRAELARLKVSDIDSQRMIILKRYLHPILLGSDGKPGVTGQKAGEHAFRRYRDGYLRTQGCPAGLLKYWLGHSRTEDMSDLYDGSVHDEAYRMEMAEKLGTDFTVPSCTDCTEKEKEATGAVASK